MVLTTVDTPRTGRLHAWRVRWFGEGPDPIDAQLAAIRREGAHMAHVAHLVAFLLVILFSAGSLAALGADAFTRLQVEFASAGVVDLPSAISLIVSTLMVAAMDVGLVYAAQMMRLLAARRADRREYAVHAGVMALVCVLEAATYCYMSYRFEYPATVVAGAIIVSRAVAAPLLSVYLALARPLPVTSRDIMAQVELTQGRSLIHDFVVEAADPAVSLADKVALYKASTQGLDALLTATQARHAPVTTIREVAPDPPQPTPPTNGGTPLRIMPARRRQSPSHPSERAPRQTRESDAATEARIRAIWNAAPLRPGRGRLSNTALTRKAGVSTATASKWANVLKLEDELAAATAYNVMDTHDLRQVAQ